MKNHVFKIGAKRKMLAGRGFRQRASEQPVSLWENVCQLGNVTMANTCWSHN